MASTRDALQELDYALIDVQRVLDLGIKIEKTPGSTKDEQANSSLHTDLVELTADKVLGLAKEITRAGTHRCQYFDVTKFLKEAVSSGRIKIKDLKPGLQDKLHPRIP